MQPSAACIDLIKRSESCRLTSYRDVAGVLTIGWGHIGADVLEDMTWTQQQADDMLDADIAEHYDQMSKLVTVPLSQGQTDALTDFTFNMGAGALAKSSILYVLNHGQYSAVPDRLYRVDEDGAKHGYIFGEGVILPGLVIRREAEIELWNV